MNLLNHLSAADARWSERLRIDNGRHALRTAAIVLAHSGDSLFWIAGLLLALWQGPGFWQRAARIDLIGIAVTAAVVQIIKWLVRRPRPRGEWGQSYRKVDPHSFPSGHAARAVMLAVLAVALGPAWWAIALLIWAPLVALSRVAMGVHYLSDIAAGAVCGAACGLMMAIFFAK